jgi:hypothetical protein
MKWTAGCVAISIAFLLALGVASWRSPQQLVLIESYKVLLTFTLLGVIALFVKAAIDARLDDERESRRRHEEAQKESSRRYEEWERTRASIIAEFIDIFSQFYSLRKLYHSARSRSNRIYRKPSPEYEQLLRRCLKKTTDLEGRYGALKTWIIRHFGLPTGDFGYKEIPELIKKKEQAVTEAQRLRCSLDILGEAYDDWRHALEKGRKIEVTESWNEYEQLLGFLDQQTWQRPN